MIRTQQSTLGNNTRFHISFENVRILSCFFSLFCLSFFSFISTRRQTFSFFSARYPPPPLRPIPLSLTVCRAELSKVSTALFAYSFESIREFPAGLLQLAAGRPLILPVEFLRGPLPLPDIRECTLWKKQLLDDGKQKACFT